MGIDYTRLNTDQLLAAYSDHPRILCLAGAGTGKTAVLTHRIARLWESGISPKNMLALTFTRAAGAEMKERVISLTGADGKKLFCNTFHAFGVDVIRANAERLGYESNFSIYDQQESDEILSEVLTELKYKIPAKKVMDVRQGKTDGMTATTLKQAERAAKEYDFRLRRNNAFDFDGLISTLKRAIRDDREIHDKLRGRFKYVFVDEFQDTDPEQWEIVQALNPENLFVVGDDFQSVYKFRGADVNIILDLANNPDWYTVKLERNYRSTTPIIAAANTLIKHNRQTEKRLTTDKEGIAIEFREPKDGDAEITDIVPLLESNQLLAAHGRGQTTAIIARTNRQLDIAKAILEANGVSCETASAADNPLSGKNAKNLLAWITAVENPQDDVAMRKIAALIISKAAILEVERIQLSGSGSFTDALRETVAGNEFLNLFTQHKEDFLNAVDISSGAVRLAKNLGIETDGALLEIFHWQEKQISLGESATAAALLEYVRLCNVAEKPAMERDPSKTYIMTAHGSKGLEFDEVYIIGAAQGIFPNRGDIEEERRLFYVAMTRAREYLNISCPREYADWGGISKPTMPSQFIAEAGIQILDE